MYKCPDCTNEYDKLISLSLHYRKGHKKTSKELAISLNHGGQEPTCRCGCGQPVKFLDISRGFSEFILGHAARVPGKNNWGNNAKAKEKSLETRKEMIKSGEWKPFSEKSTGEHWAKGKTKETDLRIAKAMLTRETKEYKLVSSQRMKENRKNGTIPTLIGPSHPQWNGGTSSLLATCHADKRLFDEWKYPKLLASKFTCQTCGKENRKGNQVILHVHHDKIKMSTIVRLCAEQNDWEDFYGKSLKDSSIDTFEIKKKISNDVCDFHIKNNVSGVVLCEVCHNIIHDKMNFIIRD
jgi:hypothetical protein